MICKLEIDGIAYYVVGQYNPILSILKGYKVKYSKFTECRIPTPLPTVLYDIGRLINHINNTEDAN